MVSAILGLRSLRYGLFLVHGSGLESVPVFLLSSIGLQGPVAPDVLGLFGDPLVLCRWPQGVGR